MELTIFIFLLIMQLCYSMDYYIHISCGLPTFHTDECLLGSHWTVNVLDSPSFSYSVGAHERIDLLPVLQELENIWVSVFC